MIIFVFLMLQSKRAFFTRTDLQTQLQEKEKKNKDENRLGHSWASSIFHLHPAVGWNNLRKIILSRFFLVSYLVSSYSLSEMLYAGERHCLQV